MSLVLSLWDDHYADMLWLDSTYPTTKTGPGGPRGTCATTSGIPANVESQSAGASVTYSNIKFGPINSTFTGTISTGTGTTPPTSPTSPTSTPVTPPAGTVPKFGQCGGQNYQGPTVCASGSTCTFSNAFYSQCL